MLIKFIKWHLFFLLEKLISFEFEMNHKIQQLTETDWTKYKPPATLFKKLCYKNEWKYQDIFFIVSERIKHSVDILYNKFEEFQLETKESNTSYTWVPGAYSWNRCAQKWRKWFNSSSIELNLEWVDISFRCREMHLERICTPTL